MSKFGVAKAGWGKATELYKAWKRNKSSKKLFKDASPPTGLQHPVIKSFKTKKNLTKRRKAQDEMVDLVNKQYTTTGVRPGQSGSKIKREATSKASKIHDTYEKASSEVKAYNKKLKMKTIGGAGAAIAGTVGVHEGAKRKFPKYKKFAESDVKTVDGKLKIVPRKKK